MQPIFALLYCSLFSFVSAMSPSHNSHNNNNVVQGIMNYLDSSAGHDTLHMTRYPDGDSSELQVTWDPQECPIVNARILDSPPLLETHGFELAENKLQEEIDFLDTHHVVSKYYPVCEALLNEKLGRNVLVKAFDHNIRIATQPEKEGEDDEARTLKNANGSKVQTPLNIVHGDYTDVSGPARMQALTEPPKINDVLRDSLGETPLLDASLVENVINQKKRFAFINVWRSIDPDHPVESLPLACCNARTVSRNDLRTLQVHYTDRVGENYLVVRHEDHEWMYFDKMVFDECILLKQWDSFGDFALGEVRDKGLSTFSIHSAFASPTTEVARPRKSIEVRCVCIWQD